RARRRSPAARSWRVVALVVGRIVGPRALAGEVGERLLAEDLGGRRPQVPHRLAAAIAGRRRQLEGVAGDVDAVADRVGLVLLVGALQEDREVVEDLVAGEG